MELLAVVLVSALVLVVASAAQAVTGFGVAMVAVPLLAFAIGPTRAVVVAVACGVVVTAVGWRRERSYVESGAALRLSLAGLVGMPFGLVALTLLSDDSLVVLIAVAVLVSALAMSVNLRLPQGRVTEAGAGVAGGALLTSTSMNGPPLVLALDGSGLSPRRFRATLQAVLCNQYLLASVAFAVLGHVDLTVVAAIAGGVVGIPFGWPIGDRLFHLLDPDTFRKVVIGGLVVTALVSGVGVLL